MKEPFFKPIIVSEYDMDKFEQQKKMVKKRLLTKKTFYDWLINYIPEPTKKLMMLNTEL